MSSSDESSLSDFQYLSDDEMDSLPDLFIHILDSYLGCRDKLIFLSTNKRIHNLLKDGNIERSYRNHYVSTVKYNAHWKWNLTTSGSPFMPTDLSFEPSRRHWSIVKHSVNTMLACRQCKHKIRGDAVLLPLLYVKQAHDHLHRFPATDHHCHAGVEGSLPRTLPTHPGIPYTTAAEAPLVVELYCVEDKEVFGDKAMKKYTHLMCCFACLNQRKMSLEEEMDRPFVMIVSQIYGIIKDHGHYIIKMKREIMVTPELGVTIRYDGRGYMEYYEIQPFMRQELRNKDLPTKVIQTYSLLPMDVDPTLNGGVASRLPEMFPNSELKASLSLTPQVQGMDYFATDARPLRPRHALRGYEITYFSCGDTWRYHCEAPLLGYVLDHDNPEEVLYSMLDYLDKSYANLTIPITGTLKIPGLSSIYLARPYRTYRSDVQIYSPSDDDDDYMTQDDQDTLMGWDSDDGDY